MDNIYRYENYREYLKDFLYSQKEKRKQFSQRVFAQKCGFSSHSFCRMIIKGERNLTTDSLGKILKALPLKGKEIDYFKTLVYYDQALESEKKEFYYQQLNKLKKHTAYYNLSKEHIKYFNNWYYPIIRHLAVYVKWDGDYSALASFVFPKISKKEAQEAVEDLLSMSLLKKNRDGSYSQNSKVISTEEMPEFLKRKIRKQALERATDALDIFDSTEKYIAHTTLAISSKTYTKIVETMDKLRKEIIEESAAEPETNRVYDMVLNIVPVSNNFNHIENRE